MARNPRRVDAELQRLYDRVPEVKCDGSCHGACCFIEASVRERERMERASGQRLDTLDAAAPNGAGSKIGHDGRLLGRYRCSMLTDDGRCGVYDARPMICRLFGVAEGMECHRGCIPDRMLSFAEAAELLTEAMRVGGDPRGRAVDGATVRQIFEAGDDDARRAFIDALRERREATNARLHPPTRSGQR